LEEIAHLNKRGPYALKWSLKPHYSQSQNGLSRFEAGIAESGLVKTEEMGVKGEPEDDEDDVKLEDMS
jgi:hypothetical protein